MDRANKVYQKELKRFLDFLGRAEELNDPNFAEANSLDVTPEDIRRPLLCLAVYMETMMDPPDGDCFLYGNGNDGHRMVRSLLGVALDHCDFRKLVAGNLGTHSIRKGAATYCAKCGVSKDHIELRGRWRGHKKQVDTYIDIERSFPEAQEAARLCGLNGAASYTLVGNTILNSIRLAANIDVDSDVPQFVEKVATLPSGSDGDLRLVGMSGEMSELGGQATSSTAVMAALLSQSTEINALKPKRSRDLFELWKENEFGIGGVKPAKLFNKKERGKAKFVFCFHLKFWVLVEGMLKRGHTSDTAIDAIYLKYGRSKSVTAILTLLRHGKPQPNEF
ncbi:hypothetical protein DYB32_008157 [Aphanomyces invadans]|uniref:Uncharacterized protein n=1 Tax=Aphanomyces invadans TaxID=157072 RepID=A0A3R6V669_9STRA|nr:hypothetical protein DYB32_008157 [Aphanomyces invadans]